MILYSSLERKEVRRNPEAHHLSRYLLDQPRLLIVQSRWLCALKKIVLASDFLLLYCQEAAIVGFRAENYGVLSKRSS